MRIIAGKWKGQHLVDFKADHIRPTSDRVKESLFNILQFEIEGARVLDLFSGTGNLTFEALSRGAQSVTAVEMSRRSHEIFKKNQNKLSAFGGVTLIEKDVFKFLKNYQGEAFDIVLADPPFTEKIAHLVMNELAPSSVLAAGSKIAIESAKSERMDLQYPGLALDSQRSYGDKFLSLFIKQREEASHASESN